MWPRFTCSLISRWCLVQGKSKIPDCRKFFTLCLFMLHRASFRGGKGGGGGGQLFWMNPWHICVVKPPKLSVQGSVGRVGLSNWLCLSVCQQHKFEKRKTVTYALWCCLQLRCLGNAPSRVFPCFSWCKHWWLVWQGALRTGCGYPAQENSSPCCHSN